MANLCIAAPLALRDFLLAPDGLNSRAYQIMVRDMVNLPELTEENVSLRHVSADLSDTSSPAIYPSVFLYCDSIENRLERKFTDFSGRIFLVADVRVSGEEISEIDGDVARIAEAVTEVLADHIGKWTDNLAFDGKFEVTFSPVRLGGVNYLQTAEINMELIGSA